MRALIRISGTYAQHESLMRIGDTHPGHESPTRVLGTTPRHESQLSPGRISRRISPWRGLLLWRLLPRDSSAARWFRGNGEDEPRPRLLHRRPPGTKPRWTSMAC